VKISARRGGSFDVIFRRRIGMAGISGAHPALCGMLTNIKGERQGVIGWT